MSRRAIVLSALGVGTAILLGPSVSASQGWQLVEPMPTARSYHAGAAVGGRWYVAGGTLPAGSGQDFPAEVDVYDPASGHWTVLGPLKRGRQFILAIADPSRARILFHGGFLPAGPNAYLPLATCDIVGSEGILPVADLLGARYRHAGALAAGKFVVSGGWGIDMGMGMMWSKLLDDAEVWDGTSPAWTAAGRMPGGARSGHSMTTLRNGREVLVVGGCRSDGSRSEVMLFDAACNAWKSLAPLNISRCSHKAVLLNDGRVLVVGGGTYPAIANVLTSAEIFDPATGEWKMAGPMTDPRFDFDMVLLPNGRVLVAGGSNDSVDGAFGALSSAEVYDPAADTWTPLPPMRDRRRWPTLAVLSDGVYVAGGTFSLDTVPGNATVLASVERLPWSELGITGPVDLDAGMPGESPPDATASCGSEDGGAGRDAASDASEHPDGGSDAQHDAASDTPVNDASPSDRKPGEGKSGCSCSMAEVGDDSPAGLALACAVLGAAIRRRSRRVPKNGRDMEQ